MNEAWQTVAAYHDRTKHHFGRFARSSGYLDWATQPDPFRRFEGAPLISLPFRRSGVGPNFDDLFIPGAVEPALVSLESIASLFELSLGLSAWKEFQGSRWALRVNPSSGNLHPTVGYLVTRSLPGSEGQGGVFHYAPKEHALERRAEWTTSASLKSDYLGSAEMIFIALTSIHWREAWKYGERAYRYCQHDVGHALAAVSLSAAVLGWRARWLWHVADDVISALLGIDRETEFRDAECEHPDLLIAIDPTGHAREIDRTIDVRESHPTERFIDWSRSARWFGRANRLSAGHVHWEVIDEVARACRHASEFSDQRTIVEIPAPRPMASHRLAPATGLIRQRRSAVAFDGQTSISADQLYLMLDRTLPRHDRPPWNSLGPPTCVHLGLFVHRVDDLESGLYFFVRAVDHFDALQSAMSPSFAWERPCQCPESLPLYLLERGDARSLAVQVSCGQGIAGQGAFSLGMIAEFEKPLRDFGAWYYRRLFWETGVIGQVLYLEAEAAGVRGTGIGCFFDDPVHELFGLSGRAFQSLYHFTIGNPVEDARLTSLPPYPEANGTKRKPSPQC